MFSSCLRIDILITNLFCANNDITIFINLYKSCDAVYHIERKYRYAKCYVLVCWYKCGCNAYFVLNGHWPVSLTTVGVNRDDRHIVNPDVIGLEPWRHWSWTIKSVVVYNRHFEIQVFWFVVQKTDYKMKPAMHAERNESEYGFWEYCIHVLHRPPAILVKHSKIPWYIITSTKSVGGGG